MSFPAVVTLRIVFKISTSINTRISHKTYLKVFKLSILSFALIKI